MPETKRLTIDPVFPDTVELSPAALALRSGGLVAFPTETVYGVGANALDADAVAKIYAAKGRPARNPLIVHVAAAQDARPLVAAGFWEAHAELLDRLIDRYCPGPLTLVVPKSNLVPDIVAAGGDTVAIRVPLHPVAQALIFSAGCPVAAPSANRSGQLSPTTADHVWDDLAGRIDYLIDGGSTQAGIESTVLDLSTRPYRLLRPGPIPRQEISEILGAAVEVYRGSGAGEALPSPGLLERHYAPKTPIGWFTSEMALANVDYVLVTQGGQTAGEGAVNLGDGPEEYARNLYAALHELDRRGLDFIAVQPLPFGEEWEAIRDRLRRAMT